MAYRLTSDIFTKGDQHHSKPSSSSHINKIQLTFLPSCAPICSTCFLLSFSSFSSHNLKLLHFFIASFLHIGKMLLAFLPQKLFFFEKRIKIVLQQTLLFRSNVSLRCTCCCRLWNKRGIMDVLASWQLCVCMCLPNSSDKISVAFLSFYHNLPAASSAWIYLLLAPAGTLWRNPARRTTTSKVGQFGHQMAPLGLLNCLGLSCWHHQLVFCWYLYHTWAHQSTQNLWETIKKYPKSRIRSWIEMHEWEWWK